MNLLEKIIGRIKKPFNQKIFGITGGFSNIDKKCLYLSDRLNELANYVLEKNDINFLD